MAADRRQCADQAVSWRLRTRTRKGRVTAHGLAPKPQRIVASVARLLGGDDRDRPEIREAVVVHGVITGTYKKGTIVVDAETRIAGYGIPGRNYFGTSIRCD